MSDSELDYAHLTTQIKQWGLELGFQQTGITDTDLSNAEQRLHQWLQKDFQGEMDYMSRHGLKRSRPALLQAGTVRIISVRMDYLSEPAESAQQCLDNPVQAYLSRYALGRDYHKVLRKRLQQLANKIEQAYGSFGYRVFVDSAPVLEKALAEKAGLGWIGKHSNVINAKAGSWFFLGELYTDLPLAVDSAATNHCGSCVACIDICPTEAIVAPYQVDARRCVSYLTIELKGTIPTALRKGIGNRIYGCDDCQLACPWNRFARLSVEPDFTARHQLDTAGLIEVFAWDESRFLQKTEGSAIRRIGYQSWLRNIAVALGNAPTSVAVVEALQSRPGYYSELVQEHINWALQQHIDCTP